MVDHLPPWMGDIHKLFPHQYCSAVVTVVAVVCGTVIGTERNRREKPAGLRTMILICLGASIFTQASLLLAGHTSDPARIAAQVVTGVGFLGAGAIIHGGGRVSGFTTAAAIWVVAAIGVVVGGGYIAAGVFFTLLVVSTLACEQAIESLLLGRCRWADMRVEFDPDNGKTRLLIQEILDDHQVPKSLVRFETSNDKIAMVWLRYCHRHRQHRSFLAYIARLPAVRTVAECS